MAVKAVIAKPKNQTPNPNHFLLYFIPKDDQVSYSDPLKIEQLIDELPKGKKDVYFILHTLGGDPHAAAKIVNILHNKFENVSIVVPYWAMSAGTLLSLGGQTIYMPDCGQLGPLDMQVNHPITDKQISARDYINPVSHVVGAAIAANTRIFRNIRTISGKKITAQQAMQISTSTAVSLFEPIMKQIDPVEYSKSYRVLDVAEKYGKEYLLKYSLQKSYRTTSYADKLISYLTYGFPDHGFSIFYKDIEEYGLNIKPIDDIADWNKVASTVKSYIDDDILDQNKYSKTIKIIKP